MAKESQKSLAEKAFIEAWSRGPLQSTPLYPEHVFEIKRNWRFDFALPEAFIAIEIEGRGRHHTVVGFRNDCEKYNAAAELGWKVLRFPATDITFKDQWGESALNQFVEQVCRIYCGECVYSDPISD